MSIIRSVIAGVGSYLPEHVMTNDEISTIVDTSDDWIRERTGIAERRIAAEGETTSDLGAAAASAALASAGVPASEVDLIVLATTTPDNTFPATATDVQEKLGIRQGAAFDIQAVCTGFIYALAVADNFVARGQVKTALVIGAETFSRILDWTDRSTCVLFGDGAGAVVLRGEQGEGTLADRGILKTHLRSDGRHKDLLYVDGGPSTTKTVGFVRMVGNQVFRHAVVNLADAVVTLAREAGVALSDIDWVVPHQANRRIIDGVSKKLRLDPSKVITTVDRHGNTSAASIPLAWDEAVQDGRIKQGDLILAEAMGGGFTWGSALIRM